MLWDHVRGASATNATHACNSLYVRRAWHGFVALRKPWLHAKECSIIVGIKGIPFHLHCTGCAGVRKSASMSKVGSTTALCQQYPLQLVQLERLAGTFCR